MMDWKKTDHEEFLHHLLIACEDHTDLLREESACFCDNILFPYLFDFWPLAALDHVAYFAQRLRVLPLRTDIMVVASRLLTPHPFKCAQTLNASVD